MRTSGSVDAQDSVRCRLHRVVVAMFLEPLQGADSVGTKLACTVAALHVTAVPTIELHMAATVQAAQALAAICRRTVAARVNPTSLVGVLWSSDSLSQIGNTCSAPEYVFHCHMCPVLTILRPLIWASRHPYGPSIAGVGRCLTTPSDRERGPHQERAIPIVTYRSPLVDHVPWARNPRGDSLAASG